MPSDDGAERLVITLTRDQARSALAAIMTTRMLYQSDDAEMGVVCEVLSKALGFSTEALEAVANRSGIKLPSSKGKA